MEGQLLFTISRDHQSAWISNGQERQPELLSATTRRRKDRLEPHRFDSSPRSPESNDGGTVSVSISTGGSLPFSVKE